MIKINIENFDWDKIYEVYGIDDKGKIHEEKGLIRSVYTNIVTYVGENKGSKLTGVYCEVFGKEGVIDEEKIRQLLIGEQMKSRNKEQVIEQYKEMLGKSISRFQNIWEASEYDYCIEKFLACKQWNSEDRCKKWVSDYKHKIELKEIEEKDRDEEVELIKQQCTTFLQDLNEWCKKLQIKEKDDLKKKFLEDNYNEQYKAYNERKKIQDHFSYKLLQAERHKLIAAMKVRVCPYCNRQYINNFMDKDTSNSEKTTADLDHFYPKSKYPYLALSLFNFIPSCQICNSRFKGDKNSHNKPHLYPYEEEFGEQAKFTMGINSVDQLLNGRNEYKLEIRTRTDDEKFNDKVGQSKRVFKLEDVYETHKDYVSELIEKAIYYDKSQLEEYILEYKDLFSSEQELTEIIFGKYIVEGNYSEQPLSKLAHDILEELGIRLRT